VGVTEGRIWHLVFMYHEAITVLSTTAFHHSYWVGGKERHVEAFFYSRHQDLWVDLLSRSATVTKYFYLCAHPSSNLPFLWYNTKSINPWSSATGAFKTSLP
jgi:hypothetical protein